MSASRFETRFDPPRTLPRPGPIGRLVRLLLGVWLLSVCWTFAQRPSILVREDLPTMEALLGIAVALWLMPPVVNIGWGVSWRGWPRYTSAALLAVGMIANTVLTGASWGPGPGLFAWLLCLYTFGHLGLSFLLAAVLATPGCEMRALPHLWTLLTGRATREHFCPGFLKGLDAWERGREEPSE